MKPARLMRSAATTCVIAAAICGPVHAIDLTFETVPVVPRSRIDAIASLGNGVVVAGTRGSQPGHIHRSDDTGATWRHVGQITGSDDITCLASGGNGIGYLLTGRRVHVWKTTDSGETWGDLGRISTASNPRYANAYGMIVTSGGTVLVADADSTGGHIHRSTDGGKTWHDVGRISARALYRLQEVGDGILANGWAGHIYKSVDDGATWTDMGKLIDSDLYAIEYVGNNTALIGTKSGNIFLSRDNGRTWIDQGIVGPSADDFAWLGGGHVLYSTYTGGRQLYLSQDSGVTWRQLGKVGTGQEDDWLDHVIAIHDDDVRVVVGGTNKGFIIRARLPHK